MIDCENIKQEALELQMKMTSCAILKAEDMQKLLDLVISLNECKCDCTNSNLPIQVYSFQFDNLDLISNINNTEDITSSFLTSNALIHSEESLISGKNIILNNVSRFGFVIKNTNDIPYQIYDILNNNITDIVFDTLYDNVNNIFYYVTKEYLTPSSLYFKFIK